MKRKSGKFNWLTILKELSEGESIELSEREHITLARKAGDWPTCACGQLCKKLIAKDADGRPHDGILMRLGGEFYEQVEEQQWCVALSTFYAIEERTADLLDLQRMSNTQAVCVK